MIRGDLIELRAVERDHLKNYVAWLNDPEVMTYFGFMEPMSLASEERWFEGQLDKPDIKNFAIYYKGEHVGGAGYFHINGRTRSAELGVLIGRKDLWDKGLGTDVMGTLVRFGFEQLNLHRICLQAFSENARAIRCYEKVGFKHEGTLRDAEYRHGRYHDMLYMSILEDEYRASHG